MLFESCSQKRSINYVERNITDDSDYFPSTMILNKSLLFIHNDNYSLTQMGWDSQNIRRVC